MSGRHINILLASIGYVPIVHTFVPFTQQVYFKVFIWENLSVAYLGGSKVFLQYLLSILPLGIVVADTVPFNAKGIGYLGKQADVRLAVFDYIYTISI